MKKSNQPPSWLMISMPYPCTAFQKPYRRAFMIFLILNFFVIAPIILLYTIGYRYDSTTGGLRQTGVISVSAEPQDAIVTLDGVTQSGGLPLRIPKITPGDYTISMTKSGFLSWEKRISVAKKKTTYIKNIRLFAENEPARLPLPLVKENIQQWTFSSDGTYALAVEKKQEKNVVLLFSLREDRAEMREILTTEENTSPYIFWSPFSSVAFIVTSDGDARTGMLISPEDPTKRSISTLESAAAPPNIQWQQTLFGPELFVQNGTTIKTMTFNNEKVFTTTTASVWFVDTDGQWWYYDDAVKKIKTTSRKKKEFFIPEGLIAIHDVNADRIIGETPSGIMIIGQNDEKEKKNIPTQQVQYHKEKKEWQSWSSWELWNIYPDGKTVLFHRTSMPIQDVIALDAWGVLLIVRSNSLTAFNPGYEVTHELVRADSIDAAAVDIKKGTLYFVGSVNGIYGLYRRSL